jgi:hypothetical protein
MIRVISGLFLVVACGKPSTEKQCNELATRLRTAREALRHVWSDRDTNNDAKWESDVADLKTKTDSVRTLELPKGSFWNDTAQDRSEWVDNAAAITTDAAAMRAANKACAGGGESEACRAALRTVPSDQTIRDRGDIADRLPRLLTPEMCSGSKGN